MPFVISSEPLDPHALAAALEDDAAGAIVCFEGRVRNHSAGAAVLGLEYDAYTALAVREGERIMAEAHELFDIIHADCVHHVGPLPIRGCAVWIGVAAAHRDAAFAACRYIIDEVKRRVPVWKKETLARGETGWVHPAQQEEGVSA